MRLVRQAENLWQYQLSKNEADILNSLVKKFPFHENGPVQISKNKKDAKTVEREHLLAESLTEHRKELKKLALQLLGPEKWKVSPKGNILTLSSASREILLQLLNDIRVGCWHALGEPESLDVPITTKTAFGYRNLMELAGFFEMSLLEPEEQE